MQRGVIIAIGTVVLLLIFVGGYVFFTNSKPAPLLDQIPLNSSVSILISNFKFSQPLLTIAAGTTVTWINQDNTPHTITSTDGSSLDSPTLASGSQYSHTFTTAGTYEYHCTFHPGMKGTIIVQ